MIHNKITTYVNNMTHINIVINVNVMTHVNIMTYTININLKIVTYLFYLCQNYDRCN